MSEEEFSKAIMGLNIIKTKKLQVIVNLLLDYNKYCIAKSKEFSDGEGEKFQVKVTKTVTEIWEVIAKDSNEATTHYNIKGTLLNKQFEKDKLEVLKFNESD